MSHSLTAQLVDLHQREIRKVTIVIDNKKITAIHQAADDAQAEGYLMPGFIDAHIHIESSMLCPAALLPKLLNMAPWLQYPILTKLAMS